MSDPRDSTHAHYRVESKTFLFDAVVEEGQTFWISPDWEPGPHLTPLNDLAEAAYSRYLQDRKNRGFPIPTLDPLEDLPSSGKETLQVEVAPAEVENERMVEIAQAQLERPGPGLGNGGQLPAGRAAAPAKEQLNPPPVVDEAAPPLTGPKAFEEPDAEKMAEKSPLVTPTTEQEQAASAAQDAGKTPAVPPPSKAK